MTSMHAQVKSSSGIRRALLHRSRYDGTVPLGFGAVVAPRHPRRKCDHPRRRERGSALGDCFSYLLPVSSRSSRTMRARPLPTCCLLAFSCCCAALRNGLISDDPRLHEDTCCPVTLQIPIAVSQRIPRRMAFLIGAQKSGTIRCAWWMQAHAGLRYLADTHACMVDSGIITRCQLCPKCSARGVHVMGPNPNGLGPHGE